MTGTVKFFNKTKGWGFIRADEDAQDVFVHYRSIMGQKGYKELTEGQKVEFERTKTPKGWHANSVLVVTETRTE